MRKKEIIILVLFLVVMTAVPGCWKKEIKTVVENNNKQIIDQKQNNNKKIENQKEQKQKIEETAIFTDEYKIDISDWQTYRNKEYGFEFRYPDDWYLKNCLDVSMALSDRNARHICGPDGRIHIFILDQLDIDKYKKYNDYEYEEKITKENIQIKQVSGYFELFGPEGEKRICEPLVKKKETFITYGDKYIDLYYHELFQTKKGLDCPAFEIQKNYSDIYNVILNSFKFID